VNGAITEAAPGSGFVKSTGAAKLTLGGSAANTYTGLTRVNAGALELNKPANVVAVPGDLSVFGGSVKALADGQVAATSNVSVNNAGTVLDLAGHSQSVGSLAVSAGSVTVGQTNGTPAAGAAGTAVLRVNGALTLTSGGKLDLANNRLIVDYALGSPTPAASVRAALASAYDAGKWDGVGIGSAGLAAGRSLGYAEASEALGATGGSFGVGQTVVDGSAVLVRYTLAGDATLDGVVDFNDLVKLAQNYNTTVASASTWYRGDFNYDGTVDFNDLVKLAQNYNTTLPLAGAVPGATAGFEADLAAAFAAAPEPSSVTAMSITGLAWSMTRRRVRLAAAGTAGGV
jgi:autotransporter-associated beta strand protein